jgi:hypothetical protein
MSKQLLHMVLGGRLTDATSTEFENLEDVDIVGLFPNYETAHKAWQAKAYATVDDAMTRYFIVHMHRLMDPENDEK